VSGLSLYVGSKFAVRGFSLSAAEDLRPHGVAVTLILPDAVATPMLDAQVSYEEAALTFSGPRPLTVNEVGEAVLRALATRPLEVTLPLGRGALARLATVAPGSSRLLAPLLQKAGSKRQAELRRKG
jgi:3-oxoacyl-[acyl-carrier protein] reductase